MKTIPLSEKACARTGWEMFGIPSGSGDGFAYNMEGRLRSERCVNAGTVLRLSAAWACVTLLSDTIATLPLGLYRRTDAGRVVATEHPLYRVLRRSPNADMTIAQFIGAMVASLLLWGNAYAEKLVNGGVVIGLNFLRPDRMTRQAKTGGGWEWVYTTNDGKRRVIQRDRVMHIPAFTVDGVCGLSPIRYGANVFSAAASAEEAANATFENGLLPTTYFKYPTVLQKHQRDEAREAINAISGALNGGKAAILEAGMEAGQLGINPADAQLLESRAFSAEEICSWFRVQPFMIGRAADGQTNWGTGIEQQMIGFVTFTLRPWLTRIEQAITKDLLRPDEREDYYAEFNIEGLLRGDSAARQAFYASALQNGWMNRSQVAQRENLPPPPGGDVYTAQSNLVPLENLGKATASPAVPAAEPVPAGDSVQQAALNGAQVTALQEIIAAVANGQLPAATAFAVIRGAFPLLTDAQITAMISPLSGFSPTAPSKDSP